jgi:hypothetical protein
MTDPAAFEMLARRALRKIDPDCASLVHLGMNSGGKTIPGPTDGFVRVPGSANPSKYVASAYTITALSSLQTKWLQDPAETQTASPNLRSNSKRKSRSSSEPGDLIKAGLSAIDVRAFDPEAEFIVYLCTNQRLEDELMLRVYAKAERLKVEVRFLEQSRLSDFLDLNADGQWLRREFFGTGIEHVSLASLREAAAVNQAAYLSSCLLFSADRIIETKAAEELYSTVQDRSASMHLLIAPSGRGKPRHMSADQS